MYITAQNLYDEELPTSYTQSYVESRIAVAQSIIELITGKFFEPLSKVFTLDGNGMTEMRMPYPIIEITLIENRISNTGWETMGLGNFVVYNTLPEDWVRPVVAIENFNNRLDVGNEWGIFPKGRRNIRVTGRWGWVLADGSTPVDIKMACKMLATELMPMMGDGDLAENLAQRGIKREDLRGHEYERFEAGSVGLLTGNPDVDHILSRYTGGQFGGTPQGGGSTSDVV